MLLAAECIPASHFLLLPALYGGTKIPVLLVDSPMASLFLGLDLLEKIIDVSSQAQRKVYPAGGARLPVLHVSESLEVIFYPQLVRERHVKTADNKRGLFFEFFDLGQAQA